MSSDITALAHAARKYRLTFEAHCNNPSNADCVAEWDEATSEFMKLINNDEANIIASLLEKLDAAAETEQKLKELDSDYDAAITRHDITVATISAGWQKTSEEREAEKKRNATLVGALEKAQQQIQAHERAELTWMNALDLPDEATRNDILPAIHAEKYLLRNANTHISKLERANAAQDDHINQQQDRIAELDKRLIEYAGIATREARRVAELEARTVNLPKLSVGEVMHMSGFSRDYAEGWCAGNDNAIHEIRTAGVKVKGA